MFRYLVDAAAAPIPVLSTMEQDLLAPLEPWGESPSTQVGWLPCNAGGAEEIPSLPLLSSGLNGVSEIPTHLPFHF